MPKLNIMNYFELLALEEEYDLDSANLNKQYFAHLAKYHPDRAGSDQQKHEYQDISIHLNKAYAILKDDLRRAEHILNLQNIATDETSLKNKISNEKLTAIWDEYDELEGANDLNKLRALLEQKLTKHQQLLSELKQAFKNSEFQAALEYIISFKYLETLIDNIKLKIKNANN